jgi:hypothetical protein
MRRLLRDVAENREVGDVTTLADATVMDSSPPGWTRPPHARRAIDVRVRSDGRRRGLDQRHGLAPPRRDESPVRPGAGPIDARSVLAPIHFRPHPAPGSPPAAAWRSSRPRCACPTPLCTPSATSPAPRFRAHREGSLRYLTPAALVRPVSPHSHAQAEPSCFAAIRSRPLVEWRGGMALTNLIVARLLPAGSPLTVEVDDTIFNLVCAPRVVIGGQWGSRGAAARAAGPRLPAMPDVCRRKGRVVRRTKP